MTDVSFPLPVILLLTSAAFSLGLAAYIFTRRHAPGSVALGALALLIAEWSAAYGLEIAVPDLAGKYLWAQMQYIGIAFAPFSWLLFAIFYTRQEHFNRRLFFVHLLGLLPLITVLLAFTNHWHHLIWRETFLKPIGDITVMGTRYNAWFWVHFAASYLFLLSGTVIILRGLRRMKGLYRAQIWALFFAVLPPWVANVIYFTTPIGLDLTPFAFNITLILLVWAIFGYRLTDIVPIARDLIVDGLREGLMVLDMQGRIVDVNASAAQFIGLRPAQIIGQPAAEILKPWQALLEQFRDVFEFNDVIQVGSGEAVRQLSVRVNALRDERGTLLGRLISFQESSGESTRQFVSRPLEPLTQPLPRIHQADAPVERAETLHPVWQAIRDFFFPAPIEIPTIRDVNPVWAQTVERAVTVIARFILVFGTLTAYTILADLNFYDRPGYAIAIVLFLAGAYFLALARRASFPFRIGLFLILVYAMALAEMLKYGFSADVFVYYMALVVAAHMLLGLRGGMGILALVVTTMILFAWAVLSGSFVPWEVRNTARAVLPTDVASAAINITGYFFGALSMMTVVNMFVVNLNQAWSRESQALGLVQQERNLLEQRVRERTAELREARDLALQSRDELRTYYQAIEQSGNSIVITDAQGNIEYVNPFFEKATGYSIQEAIGKNARILNSGYQSPDFYRRMWKTITSGEIWQGEFRNKRKDGSLYWEYATIAPVKDETGSIRHYVAI